AVSNRLHNTTSLRRHQCFLVLSPSRPSSHLHSIRDRWNSTLQLRDLVRRWRHRHSKNTNPHIFNSRILHGYSDSYRLSLTPRKKFGDYNSQRTSVAAPRTSLTRKPDGNLRIMDQLHSHRNKPQPG